MKNHAAVPACFVIEPETFLLLFTLHRTKIALDIQQKLGKQGYFSQRTIRNDVPHHAPLARLTDVIKYLCSRAVVQLC